jgi:predicted PurR-regulated permease PerM
VVMTAGPAFTNLFMGAIIVGALYFGRDILIPVVLAVLLTFVLTPVVTWLQRWYMPKAVAAVAAMLIAVTVILSLGTMVVTQVNQLAGELPRYQATLREKVQHVRDTFGGPGVFTRAVDLFNELDKELAKPRPSAFPTSDEDKDKRPMPVEIHQPPPGAMQRVVLLIMPLLAPLGTTGIVLLFTLFFLLQREDLRNRVVRLAGARDIERTTTALNDAGERLQRLFATQVLLNAAFGVIIGSGLALIGLPNASLWGLLAAILRFVPYVGAILCALLPVLLAAAVGPDWAMVLWTVLLFAIVEPLMAQVVEPLAYGHRTGLTPVAIVVSAMFWTWLWGPIGLLVSTPLTLCIVVLSRHIDRLKFLDIMFGDEPALSPPQVLYQRMLAGDEVEAADHAARALKKMSVFDYCDKVLLGALKLAQADLDRGRLDAERIADINHCVDEIIEDLSEFDAAEAGQEKPRSGHAPTNVVRLSGRENARTIVALPGRGQIDRSAAMVTGFIVAREGFKTAVPEQSTPSLADFSNASAICVCQISPANESLINYTVRRVRRTAATQPLILVALGRHPAPGAATGTEKSVTSLEALLDALQALKADATKPQVRTE